ncbi:MAG: YtpR family tRNA-binding protein [Mycoplasma sp.]
MNIFAIKRNDKICLISPVTFTGEIELISKNNNVIFVSTENQNVVGFNIFNSPTNLGSKIGRLNIDKEIIDFVKSEIGLEIDVKPSNFTVGKVLECEQIPDTHLSKCLVDINVNKLQIICGAKNVRKDLKVVVAVDGILMPSGLLIKPSKLRGFDSNGMLCSQKELNIDGFNEGGIIELSDDYEVGSTFKLAYANL